MRVVGAVLLVILLVGAGALAPARAQATVTVSAIVDGQPLGQSSQNQPVKLLPRQQSILVVQVANRGSTTIQVRTVQLVGQVIGLTFFAYDTSVSISVAPGATESRSLVVDLSGLAGQATGLIPAAVKVLDANHNVIAQQNGVVDVRGSLRSVYGLFGLGIAFLTALSFLGALVGLARHRLPVNRWRRALRFLTPGLGLGLVVNFTLSATRVFVPGIGRWLTITVLCAGVFFALGYLTPTPDLEDDRPEPAGGQVADEYSIVAIAARPIRPFLDAEPVPTELAGVVAPDQVLASAPATASPPPPPPSVEPPPAEPPPAEPPSPAAPAEPTPPSPDATSDPRATLPAGFSLPEPPPEPGMASCQ